MNKMWAWVGGRKFSAVVLFFVALEIAFYWAVKNKVDVALFGAFCGALTSATTGYLWGNTRVHQARCANGKETKPDGN